MKISIAIPTYEMHGRGAEFLDYSFRKLDGQIFKDFEVVVSDHSADKEVLKTCVAFSNSLNINYLYNTNKRGSSSANLNNAIENSKGEWIKILFQDDFLLDSLSLRSLSDFINSNPSSRWVASPCLHTSNGIDFFNEFHPRWNNEMRFGINTISSPSVISFKNDSPKILFDEQLLWMMDIDFYMKMHTRYGEPSYLPEVTVVNRIWGGSLSQTLSEERKLRELNLMKERCL